jgi:xanthine dehydrogenase YagS FAD-binding subunit
MKSFQYVAPHSIESALSYASEQGRYLGGGIDLLGELKEYIAEAKTLVNIKELPGTAAVTSSADSWTIGMNVTITEIAQHPELRKALPGLCEAAAEVGSPQIRNVATIAGNLAQHSRCWYYRHRDINCLKKTGDMCHAQNGENRYHSLFTGNPCISPVVSNLAIALAALDAQVIVRRGNEDMPMSIAQFYSRAWDNPKAHNSLEPADLILRVQIPHRERKSAYLQVSDRASFDWALVSCAAAAKVDGGKLSQVRIVLGQVSPVPYQVRAANEFLEGKTLTDEAASQAADLVLKEAKPVAQNGYKVPLAHALIRRALARLKA